MMYVRLYTTPSHVVRVKILVKNVYSVLGRRADFEYIVEQDSAINFFDIQALKPFGRALGFFFLVTSKTDEEAVQIVSDALYDFDFSIDEAFLQDCQKIGEW